MRTRRIALENPPPLPGPNNPSFSAPLRGTQIPGWTTSDAGQATLDMLNPHSGRQSLKLTCTGQNVTLRSDPFPASETGRLAISLWLRVPDAAVQPRLRVALEGGPDNHQFFRSAPLGEGPGVAPIPAEWKQFIFAVDDIPADGLSQLRFRIDLNGQGEVTIDDVQLFDLVFNEAEKIHLNKILALAEYQLNNGQLGDCLEQLNGYWPRLLTAHVPLAALPIANAPGAVPPATEPADKAAAKTGVVDRIKSIWKF